MRSLFCECLLSDSQFLVTISNNYIESPQLLNSGIESISVGPNRSGSEWAYITDNTLLNAANANSAITLFRDVQNNLSTSNVVVGGNLFAGGGWVMYGGSIDSANPGTNVHIYDNEWSTRYFPLGPSLLSGSCLVLAHYCFRRGIRSGLPVGVWPFEVLVQQHLVRAPGQHDLGALRL
jgi:hypothetical protein